MKRVCFDIASNYYHDFRDGWLNKPEDARERFLGKSFTFHAATAFVHATGKAYDFVNYSDLFDLLAGADEIITFNGRTCDLIVLEHLTGLSRASDIWQKPHHDLRGWRGHNKLERAASLLLPPKLAQSFNSVETTRRAKLIHLPYPDFNKSYLPGTYRDAKFTLDLFRLYLASGDTNYTFQDPTF
jgi:hypothetical protein